MSLSIVFICLALVVGIYFYNNPLRHGPWFLSRRFINWFPLGMTYAFLYMGRYNLTVAKNAFGDLMSNDAFGLIFAAGTGNPYFSTDTAAALRAMEMKADVILKATRVDGIYDADPEQVADAKFFEKITYRDVLHQGLKVMDSTAISLCMDNGMPIVVFNMNTHGNIKRVVLGERVGSTVTPA